MREPKKTFIKIIYSDFSSEEVEIPVDLALKIIDKETENDLMNIVSDLDLSKCSKRIGQYIQMLWITADLLASDIKSGQSDIFSHSAMKKRITRAFKAISTSKLNPDNSREYATIADKVCRQMNQSKDVLTDRVIDFFTTALKQSALEAVEKPDGLYRYVVDNNYLSDRVAKAGLIDEGATLKEELLKIAEMIRRV